MKAKRYLLVVVLGTAICGIAWSLTRNRLERNSLAGLEGVGVVVEQVRSEARKYGLSREQLQSEVEDHLQRGGIKVFSEEERLRSPGRVHLYVTVIPLIREKQSVCAVGYDVSLRQEVQLARDESKECVAATWQRCAVSLTGTRVLCGAVKANLGLYLDEFVRDYLAANPPQAEKKCSDSSEDLLDELLERLLDDDGVKDE